MRQLIWVSLNLSFYYLLSICPICFFLPFSVFLYIFDSVRFYSWINPFVWLIRNYFFFKVSVCYRASLVSQMVRNLPATETWVQSLGWKEPLEKGVATQFSILAWRIPWTEEPGELQSMEWQRHDWVTFIGFIIYIFNLLVSAIKWYYTT